MPETLTIEGVGMMPVHRPATVAETAELVRGNHHVIAAGGRTALHLGWPPSPAGIVIDTRALDQLIDFPHQDMTVTVQAGMTIARLQSILAGQGQTLPIDLARPAEATIGGAIAMHAAGPRRLGFGTLRDWLIGISFIADNGDEVKGGGRVVKNVAGYDLMKLHLGARGAFGLITQATFKVKPIAESVAAVSWGLQRDDIAATLDILHASNSRPVGVELLNAAAAKHVGLPHTDPWTIVCMFEEKRVTVDSQVTTLSQDVKANMLIERDEAARTRTQQLTEMPCEIKSTWSWRSAIKPSELAMSLPKDSTACVHAHAMNGIVWCHGDMSSPPHVNAVAWKAPTNAKTLAHGRDTLRPDHALRDQIKKHLDPNGRFPQPFGTTGPQPAGS